MKLLIIGHGFVGKAVDYGFTNPKVEKTIIDPKYGSSIRDIDIQTHDLTFVCVPTPMSDTGEIDPSNQIYSNSGNYIKIYRFRYCIQPRVLT